MPVGCKIEGSQTRGHLGVDLVGDSDELCGVVVNIFMVENVSGPETCEEGGPVDIRVWRPMAMKGKQRNSDSE